MIQIDPQLAISALSTQRRHIPEEPKTFACGRCEDTGYVFLEGERRYEVEPCSCGITLRYHVAYWTRPSRIPSRYQQPGLFDAFKAITKAHAQVREQAYAYAEAFSPGAPGLLLNGPPGTGKSHLAGAIAWSVLNRGFRPVWWNVPDLLASIRATFRDGSSESEADILDAARESHLLVLDDVGAEKPSEFVLDRLFLLLNARIESGATTILTSNLAPDDLDARVGPRVASRVFEIVPPENRIMMQFTDHRRSAKR